MTLKYASACLLGGLAVAMLSGPASAQPVTFQVDLYYEKIIDGPRPKTSIRMIVPTISAEAAESLCADSMTTLRMSRNAARQGLHALNLPSGNWMAAGGECLRDAYGKVVTTVQPSPKGGN